MAVKFVKDPDAVLDYSLNWSEWVPAGDEIVNASATASPSGLTVDSCDVDEGDITTVWLSGGEAGTTYTVVVHVTTDAGREDDRSIQIVVKER